MCVLCPEPPVIRVGPVSETVEEGGKVSLQCLVDGHTDSIHWLHNAVTVRKDSGIKITGRNTHMSICHKQLVVFWQDSMGEIMQKYCTICSVSTKNLIILL